MPCAICGEYGHNQKTHHLHRAKQQKYKSNASKKRNQNFTIHIAPPPSSYDNSFQQTDAFHVDSETLTQAQSPDEEVLHDMETEEQNNLKQFQFLQPFRTAKQLSHVAKAVYWLDSNGNFHTLHDSNTLKKDLSTMTSSIVSDKDTGDDELCTVWNNLQDLEIRRRMADKLLVDLQTKLYKAKHKPRLYINAIEAAILRRTVQKEKILGDIRIWGSKQETILRRSWQNHAIHE